MFTPGRIILGIKFACYTGIENRDNNLNSDFGFDPYFIVKMEDYDHDDDP